MSNILSEYIAQSNLLQNFFACYLIPWMMFTARYPIGRNIFNTEWDLLIVLDACRYDALQVVTEEYTFLDTIEPTLSLGSASKEWMVNTFRREQLEAIEKTVYLTGNAWVDRALVETVDFSSWSATRGSVIHNNNLVDQLLQRPTVTREAFADLWLQTAHSVDGVDVFPAEDLTDYAIRYGREHNPERLIVHYMQPHAPYLHRWSEGKQLRKTDTEPFKQLRTGHDRQPVWEAYLNNLRYVLDHVEILFKNYEAENVVITADHGEMFGESLLYGHAEGVPHPKLRVVPWVEASAVDRETVDPEVDLEDESDMNVDDRLNALGYI